MSETKPFNLRLLRVDLSSGELNPEIVDEATARSYVGGCALGVKLLYDEVPPGLEFSDPRNRLIVLTGPLGATPIAGSGGFTVCAQGALTGGAASTQAQGVFGAYLRLAGLEGLVFQGAADSWKYLLVDQEGNAEIMDAGHLAGKDTWETEEAILNDLGKKEHEVAIISIGQAGESMVRWAAIIGEKGHAAAHNGVGAVMGSKKLKAIAILRGRQSVPVADREKLQQVAKAIIQPVIDTPGSIHYFGTLNGVQGNYARGNLPIKNYGTCVWDVPQEDFEKFSGPYIHANYNPRRTHPCWACPNRHCQFLTIPDGPYAGLEAEEPEYEQFSAFSANLGIHDVSAVIMLANYVDRCGLDTNEAGWVIGCAMECFERGILTLADTGGLKLNWGNAEAAKGLMRKVSIREGIGAIFAEGVARAVKLIGKGAEEVGVYTMKGCTPRGHDHRGRWTEMIDTCVSDSGALDNTMAVADLTQFGLPAKCDPFDPDILAKAEAQMKGGMQFEDSLVTCRFNSRMDIHLLTEGLKAVTGWDFTEDEAMAVGRRAVNIMRAFNLRNGITAEVDRPSPRYGSTPTDGPAAGKGIMPHWDSILAQYYALMGWDTQGRPTPQTLSSLGLEKVAADLYPPLPRP
jgi:aldehyde:ferredoxin oxidoreductase